LNYSVESQNQSGLSVGILLCTFNGELYLNEQLASIANQSYKNWRLFVSDDGSRDQTLELLHAFKDYCGGNKVEIFNGPKQGSTRNFLSLIDRVHHKCDYFAFCDQDDIWHEDKLSRAAVILDNVLDARPTLYCSSTIYISKSGNYLQESYVFKNPPSFKNALVQSIAGGNTMVFNKTAASILVKTPSTINLEAHDWWTYILITGCDGQVYYDPRPTVDYRQHSGALVGENRSLRARLIRIKKILDGRFRGWNDANIKALECFASQLSSENLIKVAWFQKLRSKFLLIRVYSFFRSGIRRQTVIGNIALFIAALLNKI
jgi:glycosyltransferase involved in cell wall biosynthesis